MKKALILLPLLVCILVPCTASFGADEEAGKVLTVRRDVNLFRAGQQMEARAREPLYLEDVVATGLKSRAKLFFRDDSILNLGAESRVEVDQYLYSSEQDRSRAVYTLVEGSLKVVVGRSDLEVHTPTAVAAARGTRFITALLGSGDDLQTLIMVLQGEVDVRSIRDTIKKIVKLRQGQMTRVRLDKPPEDPVETPPGLLEQYRKGLRAIGEVFRDRKDAIPPPGSAGTDGAPAADDGSEPEEDGKDTQRDILKGMKDVGVPPISQEPVRALDHGFTDANVNIDFPEGR